MNKKELIKILEKCRRKDDLKGNYIKTINADTSSDYLRYSGNVRLDSIINIIKKGYKFKVSSNNSDQIIIRLKRDEHGDYIITILKSDKLF